MLTAAEQLNSEEFLAANTFMYESRLHFLNTLTSTYDLINMLMSD